MGTTQSVSSVFSVLNDVHYTFAPQVRGRRGAVGVSEGGGSAATLVGTGGLPDHMLRQLC